MVQKINPIRPTDAEAIALAQSLIKAATFGALGVIAPGNGSPMVSRIAVATDASGTPFSLISDLAGHTKALRGNPTCSLLLGEPTSKGDPLTHPRVSLHCQAEFVNRDDDRYGSLRERYAQIRPKSKLYIDFADFKFTVFQVLSASLNGGFGKAYELTAQDLA
ncbi:MAG: pyridoxamine 5-phosphate oxidase [Rhodobacteraceae bacterium]|nr:pyridoxamine 5-phosphate oxidase [Paracoccaceae bacterium]